MKNAVYKLIELTGTSDNSMEDAVENRVKHWQVTLKIGFVLED
jgi:flavin-binding protein dodecin